MQAPSSEQRTSRTFWPILLLLAIVAVEIPVLSGWLSEPPPNGSLLDRGVIDVRGTMGIPNQVLRGPLVVEGSGWRTDRTLVLGNDDGFLSVELEEPVEVRALLVQAMSDDWYEVEGSLDGETWQRLWTVSASREGRGMRTRHLVFDFPRTFRYFRLRNQGTVGVAALGAVRAYAEIPEGWPMVGPDRPEQISGYPFLELATVTVGKFVVALVGTILLIVLWRIDPTDSKRNPAVRNARILLAIVAGVAALGWWNFLQISGEDYGRTFYGYWDVNHYYLGGKYAPELGYTNLYHCMMVADDEAGLLSARLDVRLIRDLSSNTWVRSRDVAANPARCKDRFQADRWEDFQRDQAVFRSTMPPGPQLMMLHDHGHNGTPVWDVVAWAVGLLGPADRVGIAVATALDPILLVLSFAFIWATFGFRAVCGALILFGTGYAFGNWFTGGTFLRFGWFAATVAGVCCLKRERWLLAGGLLALAMSFRLFPGFLIGGVGLYAIMQMIHARTVVPSPAMQRFFSGVAIGTVTLVTLSVVVIGNVGIWQGFVDNAIKHKETAGTPNIGLESFTNLFHDTHRDGHDRFTNADKERRQNRDGGVKSIVRIVRLLAAALTFVLLALAVRREEPWVCAILGFCWLTFVSDITNYYYAGAILFGLLSLRAPILMVPYALLVVVWALVGVVFDYENLYLFSWSSAALVVFSVSALVVFAVRPGSDRPPDEVAPASSID